MTGPHLHLVGNPPDGLPEYPLDRYARLDGNSFYRFETARWLNSEFYLSADPLVGWHGINLLFIAQHQTPIGTLPDNERLLARLCRIGLEEWQDLCRRDPSPLHNWTRCRCDGGEVRLFHPVILATIQDQLARRELKEIARGNDAVRKRLDKLRQRMRAAGMSDAVTRDDVLVERMDAWLLEHVRGNRLQRHFDQVFSVAAREGWFNARR